MKSKYTLCCSKITTNDVYILDKDNKNDLLRAAFKYLQNNYNCYVLDNNTGDRGDLTLTTKGLKKDDT